LTGYSDGMSVLASREGSLTSPKHLAFSAGGARTAKARANTRRRGWAWLSLLIGLGVGLGLWAWPLPDRLTQRSRSTTPGPTQLIRSAALPITQAAVVNVALAGWVTPPSARVLQPISPPAPRSLAAGATRVPWRATDSDEVPAGLALAAPFVKWGVVDDRVGIFCDFRDPAYPTHTGVDLQVDPGAPVLATLSGVVVWAGENGAYGNLVVVQAGAYQAWYAHLSRVDVRVGQRLEREGRLGLSGGQPRTPGAGMSGGPHLHYAIRWRAGSGAEFWLDPAAFLPSDATVYRGCAR